MNRFDAAARAAVVAARRLCTDRADGVVGTHHLVLALLDQEGEPAAVLRRHGVGRDAFAARVDAVLAGRAGGRPDAAALLATLGIDVDDVRRRVEETFGPEALGSLPSRRTRPRGFPLRRRRDCARPGPLASATQPPWAPRAKHALELGHREAVRRRPPVVTPAHVLLGVLAEGEGLACQVLVELGASIEELAGAVRDELGAAAR